MAADNEIAALIEVFDTRLERNDQVIERNTKAFERNVQASERNAQAFERNAQAFERNTKAFERHSRAGGHTVAALKSIRDEIADGRDERRAQTQALLRMLDRLDEGPQQA